MRRERRKVVEGFSPGGDDASFGLRTFTGTMLGAEAAWREDEAQLGGKCWGRPHNSATPSGSGNLSFVSCGYRSQRSLDPRLISAIPSGSGCVCEARVAGFYPKTTFSSCHSAKAHDRLLAAL